MHRLIYKSLAASGTGSGDVFEIIEASARNNPARDVTGLLIYNGKCFVQLIEGPGEALDELMTVLARDPRHDGIEVVSSEPAGERLFPNWRMKRFAPDEGGMALITAELANKQGTGRVLAQLRQALAV